MFGKKRKEKAETDNQQALKDLQKERRAKAEEEYLRRLSESLLTPPREGPRPGMSPFEPLDADPDTAYAIDEGPQAASPTSSARPPLAPVSGTVVPPPPAPPTSTVRAPRTAEPVSTGAPAGGAPSLDPPSAGGSSLTSRTPLPPTRPSRPATSGFAPTANSPAGFEPGAILMLDDGTLGVYKEHVPGKGYDVLYVLQPDGRMKAEGLALHAYQAQRLGTLPREFIVLILRNQRWDRDAIIYHLDSFQFCSLVPQIHTNGTREHHTPSPTRAPSQSRPATQQPPAAAVANEAPPPPRPSTASASTHVGAPAHVPASTSPAPAARSNEREQIARGRRVLIHFGPGKAWEAVYWGQDDQGAVVAHRTHNRWSLMHLDLTRFRDTMEVGEALDPEEVAEVERDLSARGG